MTRIATIGFLLAAAIAAAEPGRAVAAAFGPDLPSWAEAGPVRAEEGRSAPAGETAKPAPDPLEPARAALAEAQSRAEAGNTPAALSAIQSGLHTLEGMPQARPGVGALREKLESLRDRCVELNASEHAPKTDAASRENDAPPALKPVRQERNERVDKWLDFFTGNGRQQFQLWLERSGSYMDLLTRNLRAEGVPEELANLVFVESGFNMHARSVARAVGPWQFIRGTAKIFGLKVTPYVDQRRDPELATRAAARYLRRLYEMFDGSWPLALAAFNSGEGTVQRAIRRQGTDDYWSLRLPRETEEYVPQFLAAMEIASDPERYGFELPPNSPFRFDEVVLRGPVDLKLLSSLTSIPMDELKKLNPMFVRHRTPAGPDGTTIRVPKGSGGDVQTLLASGYRPKPLSKAELREAARAHHLELRRHPRRHASKHTHVVRRGETLSEIGQRYGRSVKALAKLNGLTSASHVRAGQRIRLQ
ncbi:MAG: transglycosylase SLT domain-containing protein [Candidatus Latescibacteria bacterium]|nr:transglycosylase SLT domain-containing protein [Candidatus Latescibacterota bacterium]